MSKIITINGFKGGYSNDLYAPLDLQKYQSAKDLQVVVNNNILIPHLALGSDLINGAVRNTLKLQSVVKGSDGRIYFKGFDSSAGTTLTIWDAGSSLGSSTSLAAETVAAGNVAVHPMIEFKANLFYYQTSTVIQRFDFSSITADVVTSVSSQAPIFVHEGMQMIFYTVSAYQIGSSTSTTLTATVKLGFDTNQRVVQMAPYGQYVAIALNTANNSKNSKIAIWDGVATTLVDLIDVGDTGIQSMVNCNGALYFLTSSNTAGFAKQNIIRLYRWAGGQVELLEEIDLKATVANSVSINPAAVTVNGDTIYFGMNASSANSMTIDNGVWAYNVRSRLLTLDRIVEDTTDIAIMSISIIDGGIVVLWNDGTNYRINHIFASGSRSAVGEFISNAFPLNSGLPGKIQRIYINHDPIPASCGFTVSIKHYGNYPWGLTVPSVDSFADIKTPEGNSNTPGKTQSVDNACMTEIQGNEAFKTARYAQLKIKFDEISSLNAPGIIFPIIIEVD